MELLLVIMVIISMGVYSFSRWILRGGAGVKTGEGVLKVELEGRAGERWGLAAVDKCGVGGT